MVQVDGEKQLYAARSKPVKVILEAIQKTQNCLKCLSITDFDWLSYKK